MCDKEEDDYVLRRLRQIELKEERQRERQRQSVSSFDFWLGIIQHAIWVATIIGLVYLFLTW